MHIGASVDDPQSGRTTIVTSAQLINNESAQLINNESVIMRLCSSGRAGHKSTPDLRKKNPPLPEIVDHVHRRDDSDVVISFHFCSTQIKPVRRSFHNRHSKLPCDLSSAYQGSLLYTPVLPDWRIASPHWT